MNYNSIKMSLLVSKDSLHSKPYSVNLVLYLGVAGFSPDLSSTHMCSSVEKKSEDENPLGNDSKR
jgi:hypothetical protein